MATKPDESVWDPPAIVKENVAKEVDGVLQCVLSLSPPQSSL
jgi:hypothetical protein